MADVFLSYSSQDRAIAAKVERALSAAGYDVFWDQETPPGSEWSNWIGEKLAQARCVVVLWSKASVKSRNIVHEATIAMEAKKLVPALIGTLSAPEFPMGFYTVQAVDLRDFDGREHPGMVRLLAAVHERIGKGSGRPGAEMPPQPEASNTQPTVRMGSIALAALILAVLGVAAFYSGLVPRRPAIEETRQVGVNSLLGDWHWTGIECGKGPRVSLEGGMLVFAMPGTPTYKHAIDRVSAEGAIHTTVVEPAEFRGNTYTFTREGGSLMVNDEAGKQTDTWEPCPRSDSHDTLAR
jgi:hypothetical protein